MWLSAEGANGVENVDVQRNKGKQAPDRSGSEAHRFVGISDRIKQTERKADEVC